jgi:hypothetical protein
LFVLAAYLLLALVINTAQSAMSGTLGDPRGRAHALEQVVMITVLFVIGWNAAPITTAIISRIGPPGCSEESSRQVIMVVVEFLVTLVTCLVVLGTAVAFIYNAGSLNVAHQFGASQGVSQALISILVLGFSAAIVIAMPSIAHIIVQAAQGQ